MTRVHDLAHARAGDKGNTSNIVVVAYDASGWDHLHRHLTEDRVARAFAPIGAGPVTRHVLPQLRAMNFVIENALAGGVSRSLAIDPHGKSLSALMLWIELPDPQEMTDENRRS
jgi:hypothetical protein